MAAELRPGPVFSTLGVMPTPRRSSTSSGPSVRIHRRTFTMHEYLLLLHETPADYADVSPAQMEEIVARYAVWAQNLAERGLMISGKKLVDDGGRHLRAGALAVDGPYAEAKDVIGGLFIVKADSDAAAEALAQGCPHLRGRNWIEVRRIDIV
jgi:hypothetical protein